MEALWRECYKLAFVNYANIVSPNQSTSDLKAMFAAMHEFFISMSGSMSICEASGEHDSICEENLDS